MNRRFLYLALPVLTAVLISQLACGDDDGGGDTPPPNPKTFDAGKPDATLPDANVPDTATPVVDAGPDVTDANVADAADAADAGPLCTVIPGAIGPDGSPSFYSVNVALTAAADTCAATPTTDPEDAAVTMFVNFDPGTSTYNVMLRPDYEIVSISAGTVTDNTVTGIPVDQLVTLKVRLIVDAGDAGDAGSVGARTLQLRMNSNQTKDAGADSGDAGMDVSKWTLTLVSFKLG